MDAQRTREGGCPSSTLHSRNVTTHSQGIHTHNLRDIPVYYSRNTTNTNHMSVRVSVRQRRVCSPGRFSDVDSARSGVSRLNLAARQGKLGASLSFSSSSHRKLSSHRPASHLAVKHGKKKWWPHFQLRFNYPEVININKICIFLYVRVGNNVILHSAKS